jgi:hypothetical protein
VPRYDTDRLEGVASNSSSPVSAINFLSSRCLATIEQWYFFFLDLSIYLQSVEIHLNTISKWCVGKLGRVEECSVALFCNKGVKTLCGCRGKKGTNFTEKTGSIYFVLFQNLPKNGGKPKTSSGCSR